jgi:hypothetical protein
MKRQQWGLYAVAVAILVVGLVWAGVPAGTLLIAGLVLACPLMMFIMMRGMHGQQSGGADQSAPLHGTPDRTDPPADDSHGDGRRREVRRSTHQ